MTNVTFRGSEKVSTRVRIRAVLGPARFRALAFLVCVLLGRPILTYGGGLLHAPKVGDVPAHELVMTADDGDDDDDSIEDVFSGDPLVTVSVTSLVAPDAHSPFASCPQLRVLPHAGDPADHPPRLA